MIVGVFVSFSIYYEQDAKNMSKISGVDRRKQLKNPRL